MRGINWRSFYDESKWAVVSVASIHIVGLNGKRIVDIPSTPNAAVYLMAHLGVKSRESRINPALIIIDTLKDRWSYVNNGKVVNWPPRYRFTKAACKQIYDAAHAFVGEMLNSGKRTHINR